MREIDIWFDLAKLVTLQLVLLQEKLGDPLPDGLPLFSTTSGDDVDKAVVIKCFVVNRQDCGGESFLSTGARALCAQKLAALGVEVS